MKAASVEDQLKERVKELKCLYELSSMAWNTQNDVPKIVNKFLTMLPSAMQHNTIAEVTITVDDLSLTTTGFKHVFTTISSPIIVDKKKRGVLTVGYRPTRTLRKPVFLNEEKRLLKVVAQEVAIILKRASTEAEKEKLQLQLQHAERLAFVGELSAGIAHELNEPLGRILGFAQLIKRSGLKNEQQTDDVEKIIKASLYAREIIKKLMLFSRQMPQQIIATDINEIIENILYFIDVRYQRDHITIRKRLEAALPTIPADPVQVSQVIVNLITNAIHAMPEGGTLSIGTQHNASHVKLIVKDSGHGMSPEIKRKIFEPFFTTKAVGQGTGLGLSVVQGIIDSHQGKITVRSTPNKGTTFEIHFPRKQKKGPL